MDSARTLTGSRYELELIDQSQERLRPSHWLAVWEIRHIVLRTSGPSGTRNENHRWGWACPRQATDGRRDMDITKVAHDLYDIFETSVRKAVSPEDVDLNGLLVPDEVAHRKIGVYIFPHGEMVGQDNPRMGELGELYRESPVDH